MAPLELLGVEEVPESFGHVLDDSGIRYGGRPDLEVVVVEGVVCVAFRVEALDVVSDTVGAGASGKRRQGEVMGV